MLNLLKYIILGIVQGITEPLPISSSGHMIITRYFIDIPSSDYFLEIVLNFASLIAIVIIYHKRIWELIAGNFKFVFKRNKIYRGQFDYLLLIIIGVIPAGIAGFVLKTFIEDTFLTLISVGISLLVTGSFLLIVQRQSVENTKETLSIKDAVFIGVFQVFALLPGISRSGSTFIGGLFRKLSFEKVLEFSFMLYIPISVATMVLEIPNIGRIDHPTLPLISAFIMSIVFTYLAFKLFVHVVKQGNLKYFAYYCFVVGIGCIVVYSI